MFKDGQSRKRSPSDLPEEPWVSVGPVIPPAKQSTHGGRPRAVDMRTILNTIPALNRSGGPWKMLPYNGLPKRAVYDDCAQWRDDGTWAGLVQALREQNRVEAGHEPPPQRRLHRYRCTTRLEGFRIASDYCEDPLTVSMTEREVRRSNTEVYIFRCPHCNTLILDDFYAWKGSGVIFHATEEMFDEYIKNYHGGHDCLESEVSSKHFLG